MLRLINTHQDLPKEKVGRPATRFICEACKNYLGHGNDLREHMMSTHKSHMMTVHKNPKRTRSKMKLESTQKVVSVTTSPPKK